MEPLKTPEHVDYCFAIDDPDKATVRIFKNAINDAGIWESYCMAAQVDPEVESFVIQFCPLTDVTIDAYDEYGHITTKK